VNKVTQGALLPRIEAFYDAVPRRTASVEYHGPLTLFVPPPGSWPFYARPTLGAFRPTVTDVQAVRARQRELSLPEAPAAVNVYARLGFTPVATASIAEPAGT
jgi:hypothetical protein